MEAKEMLPKETKGKTKEDNQAWDEGQSVFNKEEVEEVDFLQPYLHLLSPSLIELLRFCETTRVHNTYLTLGIKGQNHSITITSKGRQLSMGMGNPLGFCQAWGTCPGIVSPSHLLPLPFLSSFLFGFIFL